MNLALLEQTNLSSQTSPTRTRHHPSPEDILFLQAAIKDPHQLETLSSILRPKLVYLSRCSGSYTPVIVLNYILD